MRFRASSSACLGTPQIDTIEGAVGYAAWASRYLSKYNATSERLGRIAVNGRANAETNPLAVWRTPIDLDDYFAARMVRWPLRLFDMDTPVDGADAFIITSADRARDLPHPPALVHAATLAMLDKNVEDQAEDLRHLGQHLVAKRLRGLSDIWTDSMDIYFPYDGFTIIAINWLEALGFCGAGEAGSFIEDHLDQTGRRILLNGSVPFNSHGGSLSEGATQGSGHIREAVLQLQGRAGVRQVNDAKSAILNLGGLFFNAQGIVLRSE